MTTTDVTRPVAAWKLLCPTPHKRPYPTKKRAVVSAAGMSRLFPKQPPQIHYSCACACGKFHLTTLGRRAS